ncbi:regulator of sirC expression with transglutaminase-like and TPR domain [Enterococcus rotai]|uniref:bacteriocin immunity protein n=1 Tax=Enterococcus rotai TaxID=118060 RepID=UPI003393F479
MDKESKKLITNLYNSLKENQELNYSELKSVLLKVFKKIDNTLNEEALISRLVNFIYFKSLTEKWKFTEEQNQIINQLSDIAKYAGVNNNYRGDLGSLSQFD